MGSLLSKEDESPSSSPSLSPPPALTSAQSASRDEKLLKMVVIMFRRARSRRQRRKSPHTFSGNLSSPSSGDAVELAVSKIQTCLLSPTVAASIKMMGDMWPLDAIRATPAVHDVTSDGAGGSWNVYRRYAAFKFGEAVSRLMKSSQNTIRKYRFPCALVLESARVTYANFSNAAAPRSGLATQFGCCPQYPRAALPSCANPCSLIRSRRGTRAHPQSSVGTILSCTGSKYVVQLPHLSCFAQGDGDAPVRIAVKPPPSVPSNGTATRIDNGKKKRSVSLKILSSSKSSGRAVWKVMLVKKRGNGWFYAMRCSANKTMRRNQVEHTQTERNVLGYIRHPFIVSLNYAFQTEDKLFFVLDYCAGGELFFHLGNEGNFLNSVPNFTLQKWHWHLAAFTSMISFTEISSLRMFFWITRGM